MALPKGTDPYAKYGTGDLRTLLRQAHRTEESLRDENRRLEAQVADLKFQNQQLAERLRPWEDLPF